MQILENKNNKNGNFQNPPKFRKVPFFFVYKIFFVLHDPKFYVGYFMAKHKDRKVDNLREKSRFSRFLFI